MKGCPNWLLHYSLFILLSSLSPLGISQMSFVWDLPLGCERPLFLNDGRWLGCKAEVLGQLTRPRGEASRSVGVTGTGHSLLGWGWGEEHENIQLSDPDHWDRALLSGPYISVALLFGAFASSLFWRRFFCLTLSTISSFIKLGNLFVVVTAN